MSFSIDGRQYVAIRSGLGGGSPRNVPAAIVPDIANLGVRRLNSHFVRPPRCK
ncbi:MAG: hypothetical protein ACRD2N_20200 [Vicinamibacterales bacterium]